MMEIARPLLLLLLLLLPLLYYGYRRSLVDLPRFQRIINLIVRSLILILLILSLAGLQYLTRNDRLAVIFLVDLSDSISQEGLRKAKDYIEEAMKHRGDRRISVLGFTDAVRVLRGFDDDEARSFDPVQLKEDWLKEDEDAAAATNIAKAIETAWGIFPAEVNKRIVLLTDGVETKGDALRTALRGKAFGVQIDTVPIYPSAEPEVMVERIDMPSQVKQGEPFNLEVIVRSNHEDMAEIRLFKNKFELASRKVRLKAGENRIRFSQTLTESGMLTYDAVCRSIKDTLYDNNHALGIVAVSGKPKVLLIEEDEPQARYLATALEEAKIQVDIRNGLGVPRELSDIQNYDLVIFSNVPAERLSRRQMELVRAYVQDLGGGFMMLGGENSFGLGGYYRTPIEEILPVRCEAEKKREAPSLAMVLVIDKSGSMGGIKIELAKEAARASVELLGRRDKVGVIAFDGSPHWIVDVHPAYDRGYVLDRIASLSAGGGTNLYPALQQAYLALINTTAKIKHVIVLSDGHSQPGDWYGIVTSMRSERITVSTVGIGSGADMNLLSNIADWGGGRCYFTQDPYSIPQIFAKETITASKSSVIEEPFIPQLVKPTQVLKGIDLDQAPFLLGYVATRPKSTAEVFLVSDRGDPILVSWRYGLGKSVAFTSDAKARWAADWLEWSGYGKFWTQLVRDTMRKTTSGNFLSKIELHKGMAHLTIDAIGENGEFLNELQNDVTLILPDLTKRKLQVSQTAPGRYEADFPVKEVGPYFVRIIQKRNGDLVNSQVTGTVVSYPEEYLIHNADEELLKRLASVSGGKFNPAADEVFRAVENPIPVRLHLWPYLLTIAACLLIADIALRRVDLLRFR